MHAENNTRTLFRPSLNNTTHCLFNGQKHVRGDKMVKEGRGRLFQRKDDKFLIYLPKDMCEDSMFPFKDFKPGKRGGGQSINVHVIFSNGEDPKLIITRWKEPEL